MLKPIGFILLCIYVLERKGNLDLGDLMIVFSTSIRSYLASKIQSLILYV